MADLAAADYSAPNTGARVLHLDPYAVMPSTLQPRTLFDEDRMRELIEDIRQHGISQPLGIRVHPDPQAPAPYELIWGERRLRAARALKLPTVPCLVREADDVTALELAISENQSRADLDPIAEAMAYRRWCQLSGRPQGELAERLGLSQPSISNRMRLLRLPPAVRDRISRGELSASHGVTLLGLADHPEALRELAEEALAEGLSHKALEARVRERHRALDPPQPELTAALEPEPEEPAVEPETVPCTRCGGEVSAALVQSSLRLRNDQDTRPPAWTYGDLLITAHDAVYCQTCARTVRVCARCGCTDEFACEGGCAWVTGASEPEQLCSACAGPAGAVAAPEPLTFRALEPEDLRPGLLLVTAVRGVLYRLERYREAEQRWTATVLHPGTAVELAAGVEQDLAVTILLNRGRIPSRRPTESELESGLQVPWHLEPPSTAPVAPQVPSPSPAPAAADPTPAPAREAPRFVTAMVPEPLYDWVTSHGWTVGEALAELQRLTEGDTQDA